MGCVSSVVWTGLATTRRITRVGHVLLPHGREAPRETGSNLKQSPASETVSAVGERRRTASAAAACSTWFSRAQRSAATASLSPLAQSQPMHPSAPSTALPANAGAYAETDLQVAGVPAVSYRSASPEGSLYSKSRGAGGGGPHVAVCCRNAPRQSRRGPRVTRCGRLHTASPWPCRFPPSGGTICVLSW